LHGSFCLWHTKPHIFQHCFRLTQKKTCFNDFLNQPLNLLDPLSKKVYPASNMCLIQKCRWLHRALIQPSNQLCCWEVQALLLVIVNVINAIIPPQQTLQENLLQLPPVDMQANPILPPLLLPS
jgi:hypothetical protein